MRDSTGADFVTYIPNNFGGCGVGFLTTRSSNAFNIVKRSCMARSYVHELGHNMGLGHSVAQNSRGSDYNYGIGFGVDSVFSTLMAYESAYNTRRRTYLLSNPDYECSGFTCGLENVADSARASNNVKDNVADHRTAPVTSNPSNGFVSMRKQDSQGFAIDGNNGGANSQNVYLYRFGEINVNQHWEEVDRGQGYYSYKKRNTNFCLDGGNGGADAQNVHLWTCTNNNQNQHWRKVDLGGKYRLEKRNAPGFSVDGGDGGGNRNNLFLWRSNNSDESQQWVF